MTLSIFSTLVLLWWVAQGAHLARMFWREGYSPIWSGLQWLVTLALIIPAFAIWL